MPAGPIGSCWATDSWSDTAWEAGSWADAHATEAARLANFIRVPRVGRVMRVPAEGRFVRTQP